MKKTSTKAPVVKLTDEQVINFFCDAVNAAGQKPKTSQLSLFVGRQMFGKRLYATPTAARQAVSKLAPKFTESLKGVVDKATAAKVKRAILGNSALRRKAVDAAFNRELLYAQPIVRNTPVPVTHTPING